MKQRGVLGNAQCTTATEDHRGLGKASEEVRVPRPGECFRGEGSRCKGPVVGEQLVQSRSRKKATKAEVHGGRGRW